MKKLIPLIFLALISCSRTNQQGDGRFALSSPDQNIVLSVQTGKTLEWSVRAFGQDLLLPSPLSVQFQNAPELGFDIDVLGSADTSVNETWTPAFGKHDTVVNHYRQLTLNLRERRFPAREFSLQFRAYNDGVAFRWFFPRQTGNNNMVITEEKSAFRFASDDTAWMANYGSFLTHQEELFLPGKLSSMGNAQCIGLPLLVKANDKLFAEITEANLFDWSGMYICLDKVHPDGSVQVRSNLSPAKGDRNNGVKVSFSGPHYSPWRVLMIAQHPGDFISSELISNLADPSRLSDISWIRPGKCAWDHWWSGDVLMNTETLKNYIEFASEMGFPYQLIDWQWYGPFNTPASDITKVNPAVNLPDVLKYAKEHNVRCWVWLYYTDADRQYEKAFPLYEKWGIAGVKIDFMARDDQEMVNWYEKIVKKAAECHLMVNFHGAFKPTGMERTYPNMMTREGILGNEYNKWSEKVTPEHNVTIPFTRNVAGPMDYTPGGFLNAAKGKFRTGSPTMVMGTRCHELAKFVVFYSPITTVCDAPENYRNQPGVDFLKEVPTTWDDTRVLEGNPGEYILMARRSGTRWFIAGMTNSCAREIAFRAGFLPSGGKFRMTLYQDAPDADKEATHLQKTENDLDSSTVVKVKLAPGGGFVGIISE